MTARLTPERLAEIREGVRQGTGKVWLYEAADELLAEIDALQAERDALRSRIDSARRDLLEHVDDGDCAGPHGTARRGACSECRIAEALARQ